MRAYVYTITNKLSGKVYIGKALSPEKRWRGHLKDSCRSVPTSYIGRALRKYGRDSFLFAVLECCPTEDAAYERERYWIGHFRSDQKGVGYNLESGGRGGKHASEATRQKQSLARKGKKRPPEVVAKMHTPEAIAKRAAAVRGKRHSPEWRSKISAAHLGKPKAAEAVEKSAAGHRGKRLSAEHRRKLSLAHQGCARTSDHRARIGAAQRGKPKAVAWSRAGEHRVFSPEHRARLAEANKKRGWVAVRKLSSQDMTKISELRDKGLTHKVIAEELGVSRSLVSKELRRGVGGEHAGP